ncbi:hypothetical protein F5Y03DRAFT_367245 [Xylaria venustula]|nr:hypothetical protein F5Y03DRAFT_367245 [Xylaria venustula]
MDLVPSSSFALLYLFIFVSRLIDQRNRAFDTRKRRHRSGIIERYFHRQPAAECMRMDPIHAISCMIATIYGIILFIRLQVMRRDVSAALDRKCNRLWL